MQSLGFLCAMYVYMILSACLLLRGSVCGVLLHSAAVYDGEGVPLIQDKVIPLLLPVYEEEERDAAAAAAAVRSLTDAACRPRTSRVE